jgi:hypothetical protein
MNQRIVEHIITLKQLQREKENTQLKIRRLERKIMKLLDK